VISTITKKIKVGNYGNDLWNILSKSKLDYLISTSFSVNLLFKIWRWPLNNEVKLYSGHFCFG